MTSYQTTIHLKDTDATGVLYFAQQFQLALDAFEHFLKASGLALNEVIEQMPFLLPIVHAEGDYFAPLFVGDEIEIFPCLAKIGNSSFTVSYRFLKKNVEVGRVSLVHVVMSKKTKQSMPIPVELTAVLEKLPAAAVCST